MVPWANGLGTTSVVARGPDDDGWVWRISLADVVSDGPFSRLPDVDRFIAVASGAGMDLTVGNAAPVRLTTRSMPLAFDGGVDVLCRPVDGPIVDINLMLRRGAAIGSLVVHDLSDGAQFDLTDACACVVLAGSMVAGPDTLGRFDAIVDPTVGMRVTALEPTRLAIVCVTLPPSLALPDD